MAFGWDLIQSAQVVEPHAKIQAIFVDARRCGVCAVQRHFEEGAFCIIAGPWRWDWHGGRPPAGRLHVPFEPRGERLAVHSGIGRYREGES